MAYDKIEQILSTLVERVANYFHMDLQDALEAVATSKLANKLSKEGNKDNLSIEEMSDLIYKEISLAID
ncbi:MAG: hypothetical protein K2I08_09270 [Muribaculaceae bacterium]|nr:hypothetical protein [Muribaculaceae bacterium]MDE6787136.1 hypothetical protein [Muribaculaceae bacterium]